MASSDSDDEIPLAVLQSTLLRKDICTSDTVDSESTIVSDYDSDKDPEFETGICEIRRCKDEVWAACHKCEILLCNDHFLEEVSSCRQHGKTTRKRKRKRKTKLQTPEVSEITTDLVQEKESGTVVVEQSQHNVFQKQSPEEYIVEGSGKEVRIEKRPKINKQKDAKKKRQLGKEYTSVKTKKVVPAKKIKPRCNGDTCAKQKKKCSTVTDEHRHDIFDSYHAMGDIHVQREFIVKHVKISEVKRKYCVEKESRRNKSLHYGLMIEGSLVPVCKKFFLNTLGISEQIVKTSFAKVTATGTVEKDKRGGMQSQKEIERSAFMRQAISDHIDKFPRVESHYCREKSTREYLSPELTRRLMYNMFIQ